MPRLFDLERARARSLRGGMGHRGGHAPTRAIGSVHVATDAHGVSRRTARAVRLRGVLARSGLRRGSARRRDPLTSGINSQENGGMKRNKYEKELQRLQVQLSHLQRW